MHVSPATHALPHAPQWVVDVVVLTHAVPHRVSPSPHNGRPASPDDPLLDPPDDEPELEEGPPLDVDVGSPPFWEHEVARIVVTNKSPPARASDETKGMR